jgi:hypothetical protein
MYFKSIKKVRTQQFYVSNIFYVILFRYSGNSFAGRILYNFFYYFTKEFHCNYNNFAVMAPRNRQKNRAPTVPGHKKFEDILFIIFLVL